MCHRCSHCEVDGEGFEKDGGDGSFWGVYDSICDEFRHDIAIVLQNDVGGV